MYKKIILIGMCLISVGISIVVVILYQNGIIENFPAMTMLVPIGLVCMCPVLLDYWKCKEKKINDPDYANITWYNYEGSSYFIKFMIAGVSCIIAAFVTFLLGM